MVRFKAKWIKYQQPVNSFKNCLVNAVDTGLDKHNF